jgi:chromosome segregation ATPase
MGLFDPAADAKFAAAVAYVQALEGQVDILRRRLNHRAREAGEFDAKLARERELRKRAEGDVAVLRTELDNETRARAVLEKTVADFEAEVERRIDDALAKQRQQENEWHDGDDDATRHRVLCVQALRARLAKTDMNPWARLRTLRQADEHGIDLTRRQRTELDELEDEIGDECA